MEMKAFQMDQVSRAHARAILPKIGTTITVSDSGGETRWLVEDVDISESGIWPVSAAVKLLLKEDK
jgi:hypothetical protein